MASGEAVCVCAIVHLHTCACVFAERGDACLQNNSSACFLCSTAFITRGGCWWKKGHNCSGWFVLYLQQLVSVSTGNYFFVL